LQVRQNTQKASKKLLSLCHTGQTKNHSKNLNKGSIVTVYIEKTSFS
jgi:hypothetical protein